MKNHEINSRFGDWLLNPSEALDFEVKGWISPKADAEHRGLVAKALIALENHGGGFLLIGYVEDQTGQLAPDLNRPASLDEFTTDSLNAIVKRYAEPPFHVAVSHQQHPESGDFFPLVRVSGQSKVPVRSKSETPQGSIKNNTYYIRRPGPASESPTDGLEWDKLVQRCVLNGRSEILDLLRAFVVPGPANNLQFMVSEGPKPTLTSYCDESYKKWLAINNSLDTQDPSKIRFGHYSIACQMIGNSKGLEAPEILNNIEHLRRYTGWPILVVLHDQDNSPRLIDGDIEASLTTLKMPSPAHADFWRVSPDGYVYLLRGFQEDDMNRGESGRQPIAPGTRLDFTLPIWRVAEFLLRIDQLAETMFEAGYSLAVQCEWVGLEGRSLFSFSRVVFEDRECSAESVTSSGLFTQEAIRDNLPEVVMHLVKPLFHAFGFFDPPLSVYQEEVDRLRSGAR